MEDNMHDYHCVEIIHSVSTMTRLWAGWPRNCGSILGRGKSFPLLWSVCTGSGSHWLSC